MYRGDPVRGIKNFHITDVFSAEDCLVECQMDCDCEFWVWNSPDFKKNPNTCWLKNGKGQVKPKIGKIAGARACKNIHHMYGSNKNGNNGPINIPSLNFSPTIFFNLG